MSTIDKVIDYLSKELNKDMKQVFVDDVKEAWSKDYTNEPREPGKGIFRSDGWDPSLVQRMFSGFFMLFDAVFTLWAMVLIAAFGFVLLITLLCFDTSTFWHWSPLVWEIFIFPWSYAQFIWWALTDSATSRIAVIVAHIIAFYSAPMNDGSDGINMNTEVWGTGRALKHHLYDLVTKR